jgi:ribonuclease D
MKFMTDNAVRSTARRAATSASTRRSALRTLLPSRNATSVASSTAARKLVLNHAKTSVLRTPAATLVLILRTANLAKIASASNATNAIAAIAAKAARTTIARSAIKVILPSVATRRNVASPDVVPAVVNFF